MQAWLDYNLKQFTYMNANSNEIINGKTVPIMILYSILLFFLDCYELIHLSYCMHSF